MSTLTSQIEASFAPWLAHDPQGALKALIDAYAAMGEQVYALVSDQGSPDVPNSFQAGYSVLLDPDNCPASFIPFGAQFVGVQIPPTTDATDARSLWKQEAGFARGQGFAGIYNSSTNGLKPPANGGAIVVAAQRYLTGTQAVTLVERQDANGADSYSFIVVVKPSQVVSVSQLTAAVDAVRPAGITWVLVQQDAYTFAGAIHTFAADTMTWGQTASTQP